MSSRGGLVAFPVPVLLRDGACFPLLYCLKESFHSKFFFLPPDFYLSEVLKALLRPCSGGRGRECTEMSTAWGRQGVQAGAAFTAACPAFPEPQARTVASSHGSDRRGEVGASYRKMTTVATFNCS